MSFNAGNIDEARPIIELRAKVAKLEAEIEALKRSLQALYDAPPKMPTRYK